MSSGVVEQFVNKRHVKTNGINKGNIVILGYFNIASVHLWVSLIGVFWYTTSFHAESEPMTKL